MKYLKNVPVRINHVHCPYHSFCGKMFRIKVIPDEIYRKNVVYSFFCKIYRFGDILKIGLLICSSEMMYVSSSKYITVITVSFWYMQHVWDIYRINTGISCRFSGHVCEIVELIQTYMEYVMTIIYCVILYYLMVCGSLFVNT